MQSIINRTLLFATILIGSKGYAMGGMFPGLGLLNLMPIPGASEVVATRVLAAQAFENDSMFNNNSSSLSLFPNGFSDDQTLTETAASTIRELTYQVKYFSTSENLEKLRWFDGNKGIIVGTN